MILAEEPGLLSDGQNSWLLRENSWPSPSFLRAEAEPQRTEPHLGVLKEAGIGKTERVVLRGMWALGGYPGDEKGVDQLLEQKPEYAEFKQTGQECLQLGSGVSISSQLGQIKDRGASGEQVSPLACVFLELSLEPEVRMVPRLISWSVELHPPRTG